MDSNRLISVIVPVYNIEEYIDKCISSIIKQTYVNLEIILVDDGSTDNSGNICDAYASRDERIVVIHKQNGGLSDARNKGLDVAKGEVISFIDGDDWIHPQMYEILMHMMNSKEADMAVCGFSRDENEVLDRQYDVNNIDEKIVSGIEALIGNFGISPAAWNKLYKKIVFEKIRYPLNRLHEDEYIFHEILHKSERIVVTDLPLYYYAERGSSIMSNMSPKRISDALEAYESRISFARSVGWDEAVHFAIMQYCDYCINLYKEIEDGIHPQLDRSVMKMLKKKERTKIKNSFGIKLGKRHYIFALSPKVYFFWKKINYT